MGIFNEFSSLAKILQEAGKIDLYQKVIELQGMTQEVMEQNRILNEEIDTLKKKIEIRDSLDYKDDSYYITDNEGNLIKGPFCSKCWDSEDRLVRLHKNESSDGKIYGWCPNCKNYGGYIELS